MSVDQETAMARIRDLLHTLMDNVPDAIYFKDQASRFLRVNRALAARFGLKDPAEAVGKTDFDFFSEEHARQAFEDEQEVVRTGRPIVNKEERETWADGTVTWVSSTKMPFRDSSGAIIGTFGVSRDLTQRKRAEEELHEAKERAEASERQTRLILDTAHDAYVAMDGEGRITDWNRQAEAVFGWSRGEVVGRLVVETIIPPRYRTAHTEGLAHFVATGEGGTVLNRRIEVPALHRDGREFPVELTISPLQLGEGQYLFSAFLHDISKRKRAEEELRKAKEAAEAASRAKSEFLANMSHEIRTPMHAIFGMTELLLDTPLSGEQRDYLETVKKSADALLAVINDILDFSKIEAGKLELESVPFDLRDTLEDALGTLALRAHQKGLELACHIAPEVPRTLVGDPSRLRQVLVNLVGNAIKFTEHGEVVVDVREDDFTAENAESAEKESRENRPFGASPGDAAPGGLLSPSPPTPLPRGERGERMEASPRGERGERQHPAPPTSLSSSSALSAVSAVKSESACRLRFAVRDTGIGIAEDKQRMIFEAFAQVDGSTTRRYGGTGLGLAISSRLVAQMGGRLGVESTLGQGSTFYFTASFGVQTEPASRGVAAEPERLRGLSVLVVDDNATNRQILGEMLGQWQMRPTLVDGAAAAMRSLEAARQAGEPFALVLLDAHMPDVDGFMLAERIHGHPELAGATVMMLSSADQPIEAGRCQNLGLAAHLTKPIKQADLRRAILEVLGADAAKVRPAVMAPPPCRPLHVLLAEDNAVNQRLAVRLLEKQGHSVVLTDNGRQALEALEREPFDLVLLDVQMPEMDGLEAAAAIRAREAGTGRHVPILAMTAYAMKGDRERCLAAGMDDYIAKPIQPRELWQKLSDLVQTPASPGGDGRAQSSRQAAAVLDREELLQRVAGDRRLMLDLVELFLADCPTLWASVEDALARGDADRLTRAAHTLRGAAAQLGARPVRQAAEQLETASRQGDLSGAAPLAVALREELKHLQPVLEALAKETG
jgi:two-component system sensor histidine kinase/response regulator